MTARAWLGIAAALVACNRSHRDDAVAADPVDAVARDAVVDDAHAPDAAVVADDTSDDATPHPRLTRMKFPKLDRETRTVTIDGHAETWTLRWKSLPSPVGWDDASCPEEFHLFGEAGDLDLVRQRAGVADEVLELAPFFSYDGGPGQVELSRYPYVSASDGFDDFDADAVQSRTELRVLDLHDFDHDGRDAEFMLPIESGSPCGQFRSIVVGVAKADDRLHALATVEQPKTPLSFYSSKVAWPRFAAAPKGKWIEADVFACGNHASTEEIVTEAMWNDAGLHARHRTFACVGKPGAEVRGGALGPPATGPY